MQLQAEITAEMLGWSSMRRMLTAKLQNHSSNRSRQSFPTLLRVSQSLERRKNLEAPTPSAIDVASSAVVEQIIKQLNRQIDVIRVRDITTVFIWREVILLRLGPADKRAEILSIIQPFRATVVM